jgi:formate-dependent nitrite reductase membrane component NrfD
MFEYMQYNIAPWPEMLAIYFFLIGTAAMVFVAAAAPNVFGAVAEPLLDFQKIGAIVALVLVGVSAPLLILDIGQPARFLYPLIYFHWTSPLSWGSLFLPLFGLSILVFLYGVFTGKPEMTKWSAILGSLLALTMPLYTGMDLMVQTARELWTDPAIPLLFVVLSITSGVAVVAVLEMVAGSTNEAVTRLLRACLYLSIGVTLLLFLSIFTSLLYGSAEKQQLLTIINSEFSMSFWGLTFVVGIIAPLVLLIPPKLGNNYTAVMVAGILGAVGTYSFREVLLLAGQMPQLYY